MHITLRAGEKLYLNGAVLRSDRKVSLELMNDAVFLLEAHVMSVEKATSPTRQFYFIVQMLLMNPNDTTAAMALFQDSLPRMLQAYTDAQTHDALVRTGRLVGEGRYFDALKILRLTFAKDDALLAGAPAPLAIAS